ncbi:MAG TPA: TrkA family potassium uptake protein [Chthonomonadales bacterium]|nr:TrkA family potassium uptake protein [Chthonomonadales bacterium]
MNVIILGCGRVGSTLARLMYRDGHNVTVIDVLSESFRRLGTRFKGQRVIGNGIDEDVLKRSGIESCDVFISCTQGDNRNIMSAQIAKSVYKVPKVMTRINDPIRADAYRELGIITICGTTILSGVMRDYINSDQWTLEKDYNKEFIALNV